MKSTVLWALAALNALLMATFLMQISKPSTAMAQAGRPAEYLMLPGEVQGLPSSVVFVVDTSNHQLSIMTVNQQGKLEAGAPIALDRIFGGGGGQ